MLRIILTSYTLHLPLGPSNWYGSSPRQFLGTSFWHLLWQLYLQSDRQANNDYGITQDASGCPPLHCNPCRNSPLSCKDNDEIFMWNHNTYRNPINACKHTCTDTHTAHTYIRIYACTHTHTHTHARTHTHAHTHNSLIFYNADKL